MLDTKGPEIRTGNLVNHQPVEFVAGQSLQIVTDYSIEGDNTRISCSYRSLPETVQVGSTIYIADGSLTCEVTEIQEVSKCALISRKIYYYSDFCMALSVLRRGIDVIISFSLHRGGSPQFKIAF